VVNLVVLDNQTHRPLRVATTRVGGYAAVNAVSVITREFSRLLARYPIFFTKSTETGQFEPAALLGFARGENLFLHDGRWDAAYVPLQIQRQPFSLIPKRVTGEGQPSELEVAVDIESAQIQAQEGERLFLDDGQATEYLQNITSVLSALVKGSSETYAFTQRLAELDLIEPVQIKVEFVDGSDSHLQGLYWISEAHLKTLPAAQLAELRDREFLQWLYFQMASVGHMSELVARKNRLISGMPATPSRGGHPGVS
jgi:SapC